MANHPMATGALKEFIRGETERILRDCTECGKCFEACPMRQYSAPLTDAEPGVAAAGILSILRGEHSTPQALGWVSVCMHSGMCVPACPENVNPKMMVRIARMIASGGLGGPRQISTRNDRDYFDRIRAFAKLQLTEEEIGNWL
ncbi:MAG: (Fe-S)-binding protein [Betaproteobacteria bacterium]|nr:(Fe-S)-binding protein [Betaproteobacteria bacterium]